VRNTWYIEAEKKEAEKKSIDPGIAICYPLLGENSAGFQNS
jgi:hypothetical protein